MEGVPLDLVIDCDPGIDDALALFVAAAARERLNLRAVTCVAGNRPLATTAVNARRLLDAAGRVDVPVHAGAAVRLDGSPARCNLVHGEDGLGGAELPAGTPIDAEDAAGALLRLLGGESLAGVHLVAVGPLTNLALAERRRPGLLQRAASLRVMGGAVRHPGNVTPTAEFNIWADPLAAREVFAARPDLILFGLDVTSQAAMPGAWIEGLGERDCRCARLARDMLRRYAVADPLLHDVCPVVHLLRPELFTGLPLPLQVVVQPGPDEGRTVERPAATAEDRALTFVMTALDARGLLDAVRVELGRLP